MPNESMRPDIEPGVTARAVTLGIDGFNTGVVNHLAVLRFVEKYVDVLSAQQQVVRRLIASCSKFVDFISSLDIHEPLDASGTMRDQLLENEAGMKSCIREWKEDKKALVSAGLTRDHREAIVSELDALIELDGELVASIIDLRWVVMNHDADLDSSSGQTFDSFDDFARHLQQP